MLTPATRDQEKIPRPDFIPSFSLSSAGLRCRFSARNADCSSGDIAAKDFGRTIEAWNAGDVPLMFGHPKSIGHGLNLQGAGNRVIWHTLPWDFEDYDQFIRRVYRQGQKAKHVFVDRLIMQDTIEEIVAFALASKNNNQQALFDGLKRLAKQRRK